jgi:hypothetical protein
MIKKVRIVAHGKILVSIIPLMISRWTSQIHKFIRFRMSWRGIKKCKVKGSHIIMSLKMPQVQSKQLSKYLQIMKVRNALLKNLKQKITQWDQQLLIRIKLIWTSTQNYWTQAHKEHLQLKWVHNNYRLNKSKRKLFW